MHTAISPLTPIQVPVLLEMIRELARFERLEHEVQATAADLERVFFGPHPAAGALLAHSGSEPAGYAIYFFTFSSFVGRPGIWLEDLYVRPVYRSRGLGRALIDAVARVGLKRDCGRYEWMALNWNTHALDFYRRLGAQTMPEWVLLRLDSQGLRRLGETASLTTPLPEGAA
jgi:GNAT superfamily N-acetyltransferase